MPEKVTSLNGLKVTLEYGSYKHTTLNTHYVKRASLHLKTARLTPSEILSAILSTNPPPVTPKSILKVALLNKSNFC